MNRHALIEADRDAINRGAHEGDGDDADDDAERGEHGTRFVRGHLRGGDLPALTQLIEKALHRFEKKLTAEDAESAEDFE